MHLQHIDYFLSQPLYCLCEAVFGIFPLLITQFGSNFSCQTTEYFRIQLVFESQLLCKQNKEQLDMD